MDVGLAVIEDLAAALDGRQSGGVDELRMDGRIKATQLGRRLDEDAELEVAQVGEAIDPVPVSIQDQAAWDAFWTWMPDRGRSDGAAADEEARPTGRAIDAATERGTQSSATS